MINKKFGHALTPKSIVVREGGDRENSETLSENETGFGYPLIRLNDFVFNRKDIENFSFDVGGSLPTFTANVVDNQNRLTEDNEPKLGDVITLYVGNPKDTMHEPIKADFFLTNYRGGEGVISVSGILHIPEFFDSPNRCFVQKTSIEVLEEIARECKLGFITNIDMTNDKMDWIQYQRTSDFIQYVAEKSFISNDTKIVVYVDQWCNLNVISIKQALQDSVNSTFLTNPYTGEVLENDEFITISNFNFKPDEKFRIVYDAYGKTDDYGSILMNVPEKLVLTTLDINGLEKSSIEMDSPHKSMMKQIIKSETYTGFHNDNAFKEYFQSEIRNAYLDVALTGINFTMVVPYYVGAFYLYMSLNNEIYNLLKNNKDIQNQDENIGIDQTDENISDRDKPNLDYVINDNFSGEVLLTSLSYKYSEYRGDERTFISTHIGVFLKKSNDYGRTNSSNQ